MEMINVFISPSWYDKEDRGDGGIRRVWEAQVKYLPEFGVNVVRNARDADVIALHGGELIENHKIPMVNHNHGLYWSRYSWGLDFQDVNKNVVESMRHCVAHTCPSEWVATSLRRGMLIYPEVIYHGVDSDEWIVAEEVLPYILWNKARSDFVSNPHDMNEVAKLLLNRPFVSTLGEAEDNIRLIGRKMPLAKMKKYIRQASVYLATARETMGIGTFEALSCGVPVAGWDWGGTSEIIIQGETGYLAKPGDYEALAECIEKCYAERERLSANAREDAKTRWRWEPRIKQYADLYKRVHRFYSSPRPRVSVVVTAYNLDKYLPECLQSVAEQTVENFECLVIDDALSESTKKIVLDFQEKDSRFKYFRPKENLGLVGARNFALKFAKSLYIRHLDADDKLAPTALELEANALDADWGIHIAYGVLHNIDEDGTPRKRPEGTDEKWPTTPTFSWRQQMAHLNQIPSCCMVRREVFDRSGGYRRRMRRNEDADFWCRVTSLGFRAKKVTEAVTMYHRIRADSKGDMEWKEEGSEPDWTSWFPWRMGAGTYGDGIKLMRKMGKNVPHLELVPFGAQGEAPPDMRFWPIHDYSYPIVSIIVTVGPGHEKYLPDALDAIFSQTYPDWECVVVNDTGKEWNVKNYWDNPLSGYPWAKYVSTGGNHGVSRARNLGFQHTKGIVLVWKDADDYWLPFFLEKMVAMIEVNNGIIYSDVLFNEGKGTLLEKKLYPEFNCDEVAKRGLYPGSSVLVPRWVHEAVINYQGGWDEQIPGVEDWDYQIAAHAVAQVCAYHVEEPLFIYRILPGGNREKHSAIIDQVHEYIDKKWKQYRLEGKSMGDCGCRSKKRKAKSSSRLSSSGKRSPNEVREAVDLSQQTVILEYHGPSEAAITFRGKETNKSYRFGRQSSRKKGKVYVEDAKHFLARRVAGNRPLFTLVKEDQHVGKDIMEFLFDRP